MTKQLNSKAIFTKKVRGKLKMTQAEFAIALGVSRVAVNNWESGNWKPSDDNMEKMYELLGSHAKRIVEDDRKASEVDKMLEALGIPKATDR